MFEPIKIPAEGRPIEAYSLSGPDKPEKAFLVLPGREFTVHHFLLDFTWRMAAEAGFFAVKAEYRGYTYRHLEEPYDAKSAALDTDAAMAYLAEHGYPAEKVVVCAKSLGTLALAISLSKRNQPLEKAILLTPVAYFKKEDGVHPVWKAYPDLVKSSMLVFGGQDPFCDPATARHHFPGAQIEFYPDADHGLEIPMNYEKTLQIQKEIIETIRKFCI